MKLTTLIVVMLAVMCMTPAWCQGGPRQGGMGTSSVMMAVMPPKADMIDRLTDKLSLTTDQAESLKTILTDGDSTIQSLTKTSAAASKALREAIFASTYDADAVAAAAAKAEKAEAAVVSESISVWAKVRGILTSDQITSLQSATTFSGKPDGPGGPGGPPPDGSSSPGSY
ncbi:MAG: periplasmic heavy metal sensor [Armatimonadota bacterium]